MRLKYSTTDPSQNEFLIFASIVLNSSLTSNPNHHSQLERALPEKHALRNEGAAAELQAVTPSERKSRK